MRTSRRMQGSQAQPHGVPPESSTGLSPRGASLGEHRVSAEPPPRPSGGYCRLVSGRSVGKPVAVDGLTSESRAMGPLVSPLF